MSIIVAFVFALNINCKNDKEDIALNYASLTDSVEYVGMNTCIECHQSIYDTYIQTGMGQSWDTASKAKSSALDNMHQWLYDKDKKFYYKAAWKGEELQINEYRVFGFDTIHKRTETVNYIVGSGQHTNSHIYNHNGYLHQAPMTFYTQDAKWDLPPGFEEGNNTRFNRKIGLECMSCHNALPEFVLGSENKYTKIGKGIDCERCHGPGELHVENMKLGKLIDVSKEIDYSIVNPAKLPIDLQFDVCQRCHIQGNAILKEGNSFLDFKPGMHLAEVMDVFMPVYKGSENEHIMASHAERLKMSSCYISTIKDAEANSANELKPYKNAITCVTCHNPHVSVTETGPEKFNASCNGCHGAKNQTICTEDTGVLAENNSNCVSCHMPKSGASDIPHVTVTDHFIRKVVPESTEESIKEFVGIACINNPDVDDATIAKAYINYTEKFGFDVSLLDSALHYIPSKSKKNIRENIHELVQISFLKNDFQQIQQYLSLVKTPINFLTEQSYDNKHAWTSYRIGEALQALGEGEEALIYFQRSAELAPYVPDFQNKYGASLIENGDTETAFKVFRQIAIEHNRYVPAKSNLGYLYLVRNNDQQKALEYYSYALRLDPDYIPAWLNLTGLYIYQKNYSLARKTLDRLLQVDGKNEKALELLNQIKSL